MRRLLKIIRNILLLAIAAIVILAGVLLFNVINRGSRQIEVAAVARAPVDEQGAAARLGEAIRFRTISNFLDPDSDADALRGLQAHIASSFPEFHAAAKREIVGGYSLLYTWQGSDLKRFHGTNERLGIEGYADMIRFYRRLIENAAG
jgi:carboxypeptidase PM20D1